MYVTKDKNLDFFMQHFFQSKSSWEEMNKIHKNIELITTSKNNIEYIVMTTMREIQKYVQENRNDECVSKIFKEILTILRISHSYQCSICIANTIVILFSISNIPKLWDIISLTITINTQSAIMITAEVCKKIGRNHKSQIPRLIEHIIKTKNVDFAHFYALRILLKTGGKNVEEFSKDAIDFVFKNIRSAKESIIFLALKLLKSIIKNFEINIITFIENLKKLIKDLKQTYILNEVSIVVAHLAFKQYQEVEALLGDNEIKNEWSINHTKLGKKQINLDPGFQILLNFPTILSNSCFHFLNLIGPEFFSKCFLQIFAFTKNKCLNTLSILSPIIPISAKVDCFKAALSEETSDKQFEMLTILCPDDGSIIEVINVALKLIKTTLNKKALSYISQLSSTHPTLITPYFKDSIKFLLNSFTEKNNSTIEIKGNALIVLKILDNIPNVNMVISPNKMIIHKFLKAAFKNPNNKTTQFITAFAILPKLPLKLISNKTIKKGLKFGFQVLLMEESNQTKLIDQLRNKIFIYSAFYQVANNNNILIDIALKSPHLSKSAIVGFCKISINSDFKKIGNVSQYIFDEVTKIHPSQKFINSCYSRTISTSKELLSSRITISELQQKRDKFVGSILCYFPELFKKCDKIDQSKIIEQIFNKISIIKILILLSLCKNNLIDDKDVINKMIKESKTNYLNIVLGFSECISYFYKNHINSLNQLFKYLKENQNISNCFILSSIFMNLNLPTTLTFQAIEILNSYMKNTQNIPFSIYALTSLFMTHQVQLSNNEIGKKQFLNVFYALHQNFSLIPSNLHIFSEYFSSLIELFSSELQAHFSSIVELIFQTIKFTPISYMKNEYYKVARFIYAFANQISYIAPIQYPKANSASLILQLNACTAFTDYLRFENLPINTKELLPKLIILLQMTSDKRASEFILTIASNMKYEDVPFWIQIMKDILISKSIFGNKTIPIEPVSKVKEVCFHFSRYIVPLIASAEVLVTEYLDDLIMSICYGLETDRVSIQAEAYPTIQKVIELFKERKTEEGGNLLDLYDSQFATAVNIGFKVDLSISGGFLIQYLSHKINEIDNNHEDYSAILILYLTGISECTQRTKSYYLIASNLYTIGMKYPKIIDLIKSFLNNILSTFQELIERGMKVECSSSWKELSYFRDLVSSFYSELLISFIWLEKVSKKVIDTNILVSYFLITISSKKEKWLSFAGFKALSVIVEYFGSEISIELLELVIIKGYVFYQKNTEYINIITNLLVNSVSLIQKGNEYNKLRKTILSISIELQIYSPKIFGYLLMKDNKKVLLKYSSFLFSYFLNFWKEPSNIHLITILFNYSPIIIGQSLEFLLNEDKITDEFKLFVLQIGLIIAKDNIPIDIISQFIISSFKKGAMNMLAKILIKNEKVGISLLAKGGIKAAFLLSSIEKGNAKSYLKFIQLSLSILQKHELYYFQLSKSVMQLLSLVIIKFGNGLLNVNHQILMESMYILRDIRNHIGETKFQKLYNELLSQIQKIQIIKIIESYIKTNTQKMKYNKLISFSTNERNHNQSEFQTVEICD